MTLPSDSTTADGASAQPRPRYLAETPATGGTGPLDPFFPPTAQTLGAAAMSEEAAAFVAGVLKKLSPSEEQRVGEFFYAWAQAKYGKFWRYADALTALWAAATLLQPSSYLEIGVCRGRSAAVLGAARPQCAIYGFDLWIENYAGSPNPGPDFVRKELTAAGHEGDVVLESGDSRVILPAYLDQHPGLFFDVITVDGDKSVEGVAADYANALPRLKLGGIVITDDLSLFPELRPIWDDVIERDDRYVSWEFIDAGFGVAAAIRVRQ
ncbi:MAG: class I SAM-dependent methyltransferase [Chloroflexi bacterium]|nr:class I SAM-dependent methyltransferase [Chloroflexota bacterium]